MTKTKQSPAPTVGARVRVERDEKRWPARGNWKRYRGRLGTVVQINEEAGEYGVVTGQRLIAARPDGRGLSYASDDVVWFAAAELTVVAAG